MGVRVREGLGAGPWLGTQVALKLLLRGPWHSGGQWHLQPLWAGGSMCRTWKPSEVGRMALASVRLGCGGVEACLGGDGKLTRLCWQGWPVEGPIGAACPLGLCCS